MPCSSYKVQYPVEQGDTNLDENQATRRDGIKKYEDEYDQVRSGLEKEDTVQEDYETIPGTLTSTHTSQNAIGEEQYTYMEGFAGNTYKNQSSECKKNSHEEEELYESITENN